MSKSKVPALSVAASVMAIMAATSAARAAEAEGNVLEEVVVTAQFRSQNLQDTPIAITAVTGEMLELRNQTSIYQVTAQAPNVVLAPMGQANGPALIAFIRGVGQTDFNYAVEPGVGIYVDDVYYPTLTGSIVDLTDIGRVEVLRGPQGTLAGRNSIGGAIKIFSRTPEGGNEGSASITYGDFNRVDLRAVGDFSLSDNVFMRIAGVSKSRDGYVDLLDYRCTHPTSPLPSLNVGTGCKLGTLGGVSYTGGRVSLRWAASDNVEVNIIGDVVNDSSEAGALLLARSIGTQGPGPVPLSPFDPRFVGYRDPNNANPLTNVLVPLDSRFVPWEAGFLPGIQSTDNISNPYVSYATFVDGSPARASMPYKPSVVQPVQTLDQWGVSANVDWKINENNSLKWISSYRRYNSSWAQDVDGSPLASQQLLQTLDHLAWSQELRWNGQVGDLLDFTLGGFYYKQEGTLEARVDLPYAGLDFIHGPDQTPANSRAIFLHTEWHLTEALTAIAGLRWTKDYKNYIYKRRNVDLTLPQPCNPGFPFGPPIGGAQPPNCLLAGLFNVAPADPYNDDRIDWRAGLSYNFTDSFMGYVSASTGYKGGGVNPRPFYPAQILSFAPETLTTYEVGVKSDMLDNRLRLNAAVFFNDYKDIILNLSNCTAQTGSAATGVPCALPANVGSAEVWGAELEASLRLGGGFSIDATASMMDFKYTDTGVLTGVTTSMITPYTPEEKYSLGVMWEGDLGGAGTLILRADAAYQSQVESAAINLTTTRATHVPGYTVVNSRATWRNSEDTWEASLEVNNVLDKLYFYGNADWSTNGGSTTYTPAMPRNWAITLKRNFN